MALVVLTAAAALARAASGSAPSFTFSVDWSSGGLNATDFPTHGFGVPELQPSPPRAD